MTLAPRRRGRNTRSDIARAAAVEARALRLAQGLIDGGEGASAVPSLFIVRADGAAAACRWEIRRFGALVLSRSAVDFPDAAMARREGEAALARWHEGAGVPRSAGRP